MPPQNRDKIQILKILLHAGFFVSGIATVLIGQVLPVLSQRLNLNDGHSGNFFIAQFTGSLLGTFLTNWFGRKNKFILASLLGCLLMAAGVLILNADSFELCLVGFFINGLGIGLTLPSINMLIVELNPLRGASALNVLNFFWGVGAIVSQPFVDFLKDENNIWLPTAVLASILFLIAAGILLIPKNIEQNPAKRRKTKRIFRHRSGQIRLPGRLPPSILFTSVSKARWAAG